MVQETITDELSFEAEIPIFQSDGWRALYEIDLEIRQTAFLLGIITNVYNLDPIDPSQPLVQRFVSEDGQVFKGTPLQPIDNGRYTLSAVLAMYDEQPVKEIEGYRVKRRIRNLPVIGVTEQSGGGQSIEHFDLCSMYRLSVLYGIRHQEVIDAVTEVFSGISLQLTYGRDLYRASELGLYSGFLKSKILVRGPWKSKF